MRPTRRLDQRRPLYQSVPPGPLLGTSEEIVLEDISTGGLSLRRPPTTGDGTHKALDQRFVWLTLPLPGSKDEVTGLIEVLHREQEGSSELIRARFEEMSFADRVRLCDYLR